MVKVAKSFGMKYVSNISVGLLMPFIALVSCAQQQKPVKWNIFIKKVAVKKYELHLIAVMDAGWHIHSSSNIKLLTNPLLIFRTPREKSHYPQAKNKEHQYRGSVDFVWDVSLTVNTKTDIAGSIEYMACTDEHCLPAETIAFRIPVY